MAKSIKFMLPKNQGKTMSKKIITLSFRFSNGVGSLVYQSTQITKVAYLFFTTMPN